MKTKNYKFGKMTFKAYAKPAGRGWEIGLSYFGKPVFIGNFIHKTEATRWWTTMNKHLTYFFRNYEYVPTASQTWYTKFIANYTYKFYYQFLDTQFNKYQKEYTKATTTYNKKYNHFEKTWHHAA